MGGWSGDIMESRAGDGRLFRTLDEVQAAWTRMGAPIAGLLAPGLSPEEIDAVAATEGILVPPELKHWWGWRNGTHPEATHREKRSTGTDFDLLSLDEALALRRELLSLFASSPAPEELPEWQWRPHWLPFAGVWNSALYVDTQSGSSATPIRRLDSTWADIHKVRAFTLTEVAEAWLEVLSRGWAYWVPDTQGWDMRPDIPLYLRTSGLI
jgi:hypothetical protein